MLREGIWFGDPSEGPSLFKLSGKGDVGVAGFASGGADVF